MRRRRSRHFNPANAGCIVALDARFGITMTGGGYLASWVGRTGTNFDGTTFGPGTPSTAPTLGTINGQAALLFDGSDYVFIYTRPRNLPYPVIPPEGSVFICGRHAGTDAIGSYQRLLSSDPDLYGFFGSTYTALNSYTGSKLASFTGNGSVWEDVDENTPIFDANTPFAATFRREYDSSAGGPRMTPTVNTVAQNQKVDSANGIAAGFVGAGPSGSSPQFWNGNVAMIAFGPKVSLGMERRILQMMGRVWRIHTL